MSDLDKTWADVKAAQAEALAAKDAEIAALNNIIRQHMEQIGRLQDTLMKLKGDEETTK